MGVKLNSKGVYACAICGKECGDSVRSLSAHVTHVHTIKSKDYYDKYVRLEGEGKCPICGNPTKFRDIVDGYKVCCSKKCAGQYVFNNPEKTAEIVAKREATSMVRYGVKNGGGSQRALEKARQTNLEKRGVLYPTQSKDVIEKSKATCLAKYDATTFVHSETGKQAVGDTNEQKYGNREFFASEAGKSAVNEGHLRNYGYIRSSMKPGEGKRIADHYRETHGGIHFTQTPEWKEKMRATQVDRYGTWYSASEEGRRLYREQMMVRFNVPEYFQSDEFKEKSRETLMATRGVEFISQSDEWKQKVADTSMREYGVPHFTQSEEVKVAYRETCMEHWGAENYSQSDAFRNKVLGEYKELMEPYLCVPVKFHSSTEVEYICNVCGHTCIEQSQLIKFRVISKLSPCTCCVPKNRPISVEEEDVRRFIESLGFSTEHYDRDFLDTYGADIVIPSKKIIIEYDGLYWHSELYKAPNYHVMKRIIAEQKGYHLIHLFSDEWQLHRKVVESRLKKLLGIGCEMRIYARECEVREIAESDSAAFIDNNHLQGNVKAAFRYGLFHEERLVAVMTFRQSRFEKGVIEMLRFCSDGDMSVIGAAGKLFSHFVAEHPDVPTVVSYADARWTPSSGAFYPRLGFEYVGISAPGYYIVDGDIRRNRMNYQRHKIAGPGDEGKTEHDITLERGLYRIYDCGQLKYIWNRKK